MKEKLLDIKQQMEERAAIEYEGGATEMQRLSSVQTERRAIRDCLKQHVGIHEANRLIISLEKEVDVFNDRRGKLNES